METQSRHNRRLRTVSVHAARAAALLLCLGALFAVPAQAHLERPGDVIEYTCGFTTLKDRQVLIAYDTRHGSTAEIVDRIAQVLCFMGFRVDVRMARDVDDVSRYEAVIVGSPIYYFYWLPGAENFLCRFADELAGRKVACFITCTYLKDENDTPDRRQRAVELYVEPVLDDNPQIDPVSVGILSGGFSYSELYPLEYIRMKLAGFEEGDFRNWDKITDWAFELVGEFD